MNESILVIKSRRTLNYEVKYVRNGFHRTIECGSAPEAAAAALDIQRRLFSRGTKIIAPPEVSSYF